MAGLAAASVDEPPVTVDIADDAPVKVLDEAGNVLQLHNGDGSVVVAIDGAPLERAVTSRKKLGWFDNLCDEIEDTELSRIAEDLLTGIAEDLDSRKDWINARADGLKLLGLKVEIPNQQGATDSAPVEGQSKVRHPLLLEAVLRFQANARSELLPTDGPVKIRNDATKDTLAKDQMATMLERGFNHYLTSTASEYYPDTDRMLFMTGFGGDGFKKVYTCPLRNRPVSESVDADDIIVNWSATDLANAHRVTHRTYLKPSTVKRMQIIGAYRDVPLGDPMARTEDPVQREEQSQQGLGGAGTRRPKDRDREIYEVLCELDIKGFEHKDQSGQPTGLEIPYRVTIDKSDRTVLSVVRNFNEDTKELPVARKSFVKFPFVTGIGFYDIGLLHILGDTTNAITAAWRLMLDCGMFANFPGFLMADIGGRQDTNVFRVPPGGSAQIKTSGMPIKDALMPLPYSTQQMPPLMQLVQDMAETGRRIGGTAEVQVGEGRADVPVGTTMAMIDQAVKVMNAVHKRMHAAQSEEFALLKELFRENPDAFLNQRCMLGQDIDKERFIAALNNFDLVPQADPNTASTGQRLMKVMGLKQLQGASPNLYNPIKCDTAALGALGWSNPEEFFVPASARGAPPPELQKMQAEAQNEKTKADADAMRAQADLIEAKAVASEAADKIASGAHHPKPDAPPVPDTLNPADVVDAQAKMMDAQTRRREVELRAHEIRIEDQNRDLDRQATERDAALSLAKDLTKVPPSAQNVGPKVNKIIDQIGKQP